MNRKFLIIFSATILSVLIFFLLVSFLFLRVEKEIFNSQSISNSHTQKEETLESFFGNIKDYELAFADSQNLEKKRIVAGITSHHFLAKDLIARFYSGVSNKVENIVLIGPDHYDLLTSREAEAVTTKITWATPYGNIEANNNSIENILNNNIGIEINDNIFKMEHSIYVEIPFIKKAFPQAKVIPLVIKNSDNYHDFETMGRELKDILEDETIMIISSDFSHGLTEIDAKKYDDQSIDILENLKIENINKLNCDCKACMAIMSGFLGDNKNFHLIENKNSADFGSPDEKVTSYVSGYFLKE
ncbi:MAG: AmmeMemoRadiSam system protein B [Candidatus Moraniibacteriota bacterium]